MIGIYFYIILYSIKFKIVLLLVCYSYHCQNPYIVRTSVLEVFPFPTKRNGRYYIGGAGHELYPEICPIACRPPDHQDWEYC
jgi:hypothetical protein